MQRGLYLIYKNLRQIRPLRIYTYIYVYSSDGRDEIEDGNLAVRRLKGG